jgi:UDP-N-acetylmuramoyl-L-alanyl-D-glutamate--2,6-diaminopimelate ligase
MKKLSEFISFLSPTQVINFQQDTAIAGIACRPEAVREDTLYCVMDEFLQYGHWVEGEHLLRSIESKDDIKALLVERPIPDIPLPQLIIPDARKATARAAKYFFNSPDEEIQIVGVTGTNGKTTATHLISRILAACGVKAAALGTIGVFIGSEKYADTVYTTALSPDFFESLAQLRDMEVSVLAAEISSHALKLDRVFGLDTDIAVFTNLTRDHLDFHETIADYRASKMKLFSALRSDGAAVVNLDDPLGKEIASVCPCPVITYGCRPGASLRAELIKCTPGAVSFLARYGDKTFPIVAGLVGYFNVYNLLAAIGTCLALGIKPDELEIASRGLTGVAGRIEAVPLPGDRVGIVDYAHTPDSLEKILEAIRATGAKRIITVFGCGGDRDRGKRPLMGEIAARLSDLCVVTSDNPRREDPLAIIQDILAGMPKEGVIAEPGRRKAICTAYEMSQAGDVILVAGKGHEPYQIIGDEYFPFDDREELCRLK